MKLIDGWSRKLHKLWTTRVAFGGVALGLLADAFPQLQGVLPTRWYLAIFALIIVVRMVAQEKIGDA